jgi:uncharacterized membrane protein YdjX (TVP38/TMEM64 family)
VLFDATDGRPCGRHLDHLEAAIAGLGPWALAVFMVLYAVLGSLFVPDLLLGIVAGASFGFTRGVAVAAAGTLGGASLQYALSRRLLKRAIDRFVLSRPALAAIQLAARRQELRLQLLIRLTLLNRALTSYMLGAVGVGFGRFATACDHWPARARRAAISTAASAVHPVWCDAPSPSPVSPWKYS